MEHYADKRVNNTSGLYNISSKFMLMKFQGQEDVWLPTAPDQPQTSSRLAIWSSVRKMMLIAQETQDSLENDKSFLLKSSHVDVLNAVFLTSPHYSVGRASQYKSEAPKFNP